MSRAYRIRVRESVSRVVKGKDSVSTQLEILEILPPEQIGELLCEELEERGFERDGDVMVRRQENGITVTVDPKTGVATVEVEGEQKVDIQKEREGHAWDDVGPSADNTRKALKDQLKKDLEKDVERATEKLQKEVTDRLEAELGEVRRELDQAVNKVTGEALKQKAGQMGTIKELTEDPESGNMTIVVEV
jgi:hypothetical protein